MDNYKLIQLVHEHESLWYVKCDNYNNREMARQIWKDIAKKMGVDVNAVKTKWRSLRDTFRKEQNKLDKRRRECNGEFVKAPSLPYFKSMLFIKDQVPTQELDSEIDPFIQQFDTEQQEETTSYNIKCESPYEPRIKKRKRKSSIDFLKVDLEKKDEEFKPRTDELDVDESKSDQDADYHFLMSLLPYLREVEKYRKLSVRMKLQQVFCDEEKKRKKKIESSSSEESSE